MTGTLLLNLVMVSAAAQAQAPTQTPTLTANTSIDATLTSTIDAKRAKPGDQVTARTDSDVHQSGKVVIRKGSKLVGHVTEAAARTKEHPQSKIGIVFDKAVDHGTEVPINAVMQAIIAPPPPDDPIMPGAPTGGQTQTLGTGGGSIGGNVATKTMAVRGVGTDSNLIPNIAKDANAPVAPVLDRVRGLPGVTLQAAAAGSSDTDLVSNTHNIHLDSGTHLVLTTSATATTK